MILFDHLSVVKIKADSPRNCPFCNNPVNVIFEMADGYGNHDHRADTVSAKIECKNCKIQPKISINNYNNCTDDKEKVKWADKVREMINMWNGVDDTKDIY
ncbi:MAG: hypothetical protein IJ094_12910 [Bacilli bacterium]|nr:hypothetical protein [Bacilli bacterium]